MLIDVVALCGQQRPTWNKEPYIPDWTSALKLDTNRQVIDGSSKALADAVRDGADLRIYTEFCHNEHIDVTSDNDELIREVAEFR